MKNVVNVAFVAAFVMVFSVRMFNVEKSATLSEIALVNVIALAADDDFTDLCVTRPNSECYALIATPSGSECLIWLDKINIIF